jgi:hypothetical protein
VTQAFGPMLNELASSITDLRANFADPQAQGTVAYVDQFVIDHPEVDAATAAADCQLAVLDFCHALLRLESVRAPAA